MSYMHFFKKSAANGHPKVDSVAMAVGLTEH